MGGGKEAGRVTALHSALYNLDALVGISPGPANTGCCISPCSARRLWSPNHHAAQAPATSACDGAVVQRVRARPLALRGAALTAPPRDSAMDGLGFQNDAHADDRIKALAELAVQMMHGEWHRAEFEHYEKDAAKVPKRQEPRNYLRRPTFVCTDRQLTARSHRPALGRSAGNSSRCSRCRSCTRYAHHLTPGQGLSPSPGTEYPARPLSPRTP